MENELGGRVEWMISSKNIHNHTALKTSKEITPEYISEMVEEKTEVKKSSKCKVLQPMSRYVEGRTQCNMSIIKTKL